TARRTSGRHYSESFFYLSHVRAFSGPLVKGEVLADSDQPKALTSRSLEVEVRVWHLEIPHKTRLEDFSPRLFEFVGLDFQPDRSCRPQELALIRDITVEKCDVEVLSQANEVPFGIRFRDFAAEDITIELTNRVPVPPRNQNRRVVSKNDFCHGYSFPEWALSTRYGSGREMERVSSRDFSLEMPFGQPPATASMNFEGSRSMVWMMESLTAGPLGSSSNVQRESPSAFSSGLCWFCQRITRRRGGSASRISPSSRI